MGQNYEHNGLIDTPIVMGQKEGALADGCTDE